MYECMRRCVVSQTKGARKTFLENITRRNMAERIGKKCHYVCCVQNKINNVKFNNKYPFRVFLGGDEFLSALFSLGNLLCTIGSYHFIIKKVPGNSQLVRLNRLAIKINITSWVFSTVYHYHVCRLTRDVDYFFALLNILMNFYIFLLRLLYIHKQHVQVESLHKKISVVVAVFYVMHVYTMYFVDFSFKRHKQISSVFFAISAMMWFYLVLTFRSLPHSKYLLIFAVGVCLSGTIEICDIPPMHYLLDSHAIYHFLTIFLQPFYYLFIRHDLEHIIRTTAQKNNKA